MSLKSVGLTVVLVGLMIVISNRDVTQKIEKIDVRVSHLEEEVLGQVPVTQRNAPTSERDLECLARNIFYEAGVESEIGKYAVAQVTLNRWQMKQPKSICNTIYAKKQVGDKWVCQFSWACKGVLRPPEGPNWIDSQMVAVEVLLNGVRVLPLQEATHYHADYVQPNWAETEKMIWQEGSHIFYKGAKIVFVKAKGNV